MARVEQNFLHWWKNWFSSVWESLVPVKKWRTQQRNLQFGDIVLLKYSAKYTKPTYRYGKIISTIKDDNGFVRDVKHSVMDHQLYYFFLREGCKIQKKKKYDICHTLV